MRARIPYHTGATLPAAGGGFRYNETKPQPRIWQSATRASDHLPFGTTKGADDSMSHPTQGQNHISPEVASKLATLILRSVSVEPTGCWIRTRRDGAPHDWYTKVHTKIGGKRTYFYAHRIMFVRSRGPIPEGFTVDHLCEVPACCNPAHLRAVPHHANVLRSKTNFYAINARKTHCVRGHELPPYKLGGKRNCSECKRIWQANSRARKGGAAA